jgi:tyrosine-protein kinase Etk/Wzc
MSETVPMTEPRNDLAEFFLMLLRRRRFLVWNTLVVTLLVLGITFVLTPRFTAVTTILPPQSEGEGLMGLSGLLQRFDLAQLSLTGATSSAQVYVAILKSRTVGDTLVARHDLVRHYKVKTAASAERALRGKTNVKLASSGVIQVSVTDKDRDLAATLANAYVVELDRLSRALRSSDGKRTRIFIEERIEATQTRLTAAEDSLLVFQKQHPGMVVPPEVAASAGATADLMAQRIAVGYELELLRSTLSASAPPLVRKETEVAALDSELGGVPDLGMEMARRYRDFKVQEKVFELLSAQLEAARIKESKDVTTVSVLDTAVPPDRRSFPRRGLMTALAFLVSLLLGTLIAVGLEILTLVRVADAARFRSTIPPGGFLDRLLFGSGHREAD